MTAAATILILAAGSSSRMRGTDKLLERVDGVPLLRAQAIAALATGLPVLVTLPPDRPLRAAALDGLAVARITVTDAAEGMAASIRAGVAEVPQGAALLILLADLPEITTDDLRAVHVAMHAHPEAILRATAEDGRPGHPILFPPHLLPDLAALHGDTGARSLLARHPMIPVPLPGGHATTDLDTPEDWSEWRHRTGR